MSNEHKPMTDDELDAIKGRLAAITEWPWIAFCRTGVRHRMGITNKRLFDDGDAPEVLDVVELGDNAGGIKSEADAVFIANAPTDIARLLAENERLRSEVTRLDKEADWFIEYIWNKDIFRCPMPEGYKCEHKLKHVCCLDSEETEIRGRCWRKAARKAVEEEERHG